MLSDDELTTIKAKAEASLKPAPEYGATYDFMVDVWPKVIAELDRLRKAEAVVRALCAEEQDEGGADTDTLWPSEVLSALEGETVRWWGS